MRTFIIAVALVGSCLAVPQTFEKTVGYEVPFGKVSFYSGVPVDGVYGHYYGEVEPAFRYGQVGVKYGVSKPAVKSVVAQPVQAVQTFGVQPFQQGLYGGYVQPAVRFNVPAKVGKPVVPFVKPVTPFVKYFAEGANSQSVAPVFHHVAPVVQQVAPVVQRVAPAVPQVAPVVPQVAPVVQRVAPVVQQVAPVTYPKVSYPFVQHTPYQSFEKVVKPVTRFATPSVQTYAKFAPVTSPVARIGHVAPVLPAVQYAPAVAPVQPVKYGLVSPVHQQGVAVKSEAPAAILAQSQDSSADGDFVANFQTENGIQSTVSGTVKSVPGGEPAQVMSGSYSYTSPDGTPVVTTWYADENGFHADGDHIPAVPQEIQKSLEYIHSLPVTQPEFNYVKY